MATGVAMADSVLAQDISLNYESLSSMEEPLATEVGDMTLVLTGLLDTRLTIDGEDNRDSAEPGLIGNFQFSSLAQLPNRWRVGLAYFGQYATDPTSVFGTGEGYADNAALSVGGSWGTVLGGNVSGTVRERTRRLRGAGNAALALDDFLGELDDWSGGYAGRFGPWVVGAVVDGDGNVDLGAMFQRPIAVNDYRLTARFAKGAYTSADRRRFDTRAAGGVGELIYGSSAYDVGVVYERLSSGGLDMDRWYVSAGARTKTGVLSLSVEGHYGQIEGQDEVSAALGVQYDLARGLSVNLGLNRAEAEAIVDGASFLDIKETKAVLSLRYSF